MQKIEQFIRSAFQDPEQFIRQSKQQVEEGDYSAALNSLDRALQLSPRNASYWYQKGNILAYNLQDPQGALDAFDNALQVVTYDDLHKKILNGRGNVLKTLRNNKDSNAAYQKALKLDPSYWQARKGLGWLMFRHSEYLEAVAKLDEGLPLSQSKLKDKRPGVQRYHQIGCAELHRTQGRIHYQYGLQQQDPFPYWDKAHKSYEEALQFLNTQDFPEERLEVIEELIQVFLALEKIEEAKYLQREGSDLLNRLLNQTTNSRRQRYFALKFTGFNQLTVDIKVRSGRILEAWETAEEGKNICLKWLLWEQDLLVPQYDETQQLLDPSTAAIYWHLSPSALTTFILKSDTLTPTLVNLASSSTGKIPEPLDRLIKLENWVTAWDERYANYRDKGKTDVEDKQNHPWRFSMEAALEDLKKLLCISEIEAELSNISKLILIPHRDLHRFPLHVLFNEQLSITYLPSIRVGLDLQERSSIEPWHLQPVLNVDDPAVDGVDQMPYAQLESAVVQKLFSTSVSITREQATKAAVTEALDNNYQVFHFTGHGEYNGDQPELSQLGLADGCLTATEIGHLNLRSYNLVTIAACETALTGNQTMTTEYVGLVSAFLKAKVSHVLSTLWAVEEISNAWIVIRFYQFLLEGVAPALALAKAQQWLRTITGADLAYWLTKISHLEGLDPLIKQDLEQQAYSLENSSTILSGRSIYSHPYYWAAFTLTGRGFL